ncbi:MAG: hypothetical protein KY468_08435 [Armatimonadetes bacterium]|nr:hypothetical protein [Armatimonadota bacterium]
MTSSVQNPSPSRPQQDRIGVNRGAQMPPPRVVVFVIDRVTLEDLFRAQAPHLQRFFRRNAVGLMNFASAQGRTVEGSYATLSAGMHAVAPEEAGLFRSAVETYEGGTARNAFLRRTGMRAGAGTVLNLGIAPLLKLNQERRTGAAVGALGAYALHGGPTVALGNSDAPLPEEPPLRFAPLLAMRPTGIVDRGDVSPRLLRPDPTAPYGVSTDPAKLEAVFRRDAPGASLVVADLGETTRAHAYRDLVSEDVYRQHLLRALSRADALFARLMRHVDPRRTRVLVLTPFPPLPRGGKENAVARLAPIAVSSPDPALLSSGTTQGSGLVANIDVAPAIAKMLWESAGRFEFAGVLATFPARPEAEMTGSLFTAHPTADSLRYLRRLDAAVEAQRLAASGGFLVAVAATEILMAGAALALVLRRGRRKYGQRLLGRFCLCAAVTLTLAMVVAGEQMPGSVRSLALITFGVWLALSLVFLVVGRLAVPTAMLATGLALLADLYTGGLGLRLSPLSDFPIIGVRFHGLANEYMGIVIGAILMSACMLPDLIPRLNSRAGRGMILFLFGAAAASIGIPTLGDNAGGLIAAVMAFGSAGLLLYGLPIRGKNLLGLLLLAFCVLWILAALDSTRSGPSHFGRSVLMAREEGIGYLLEIIGRKIALNVRMMFDPRSLLVYVGAGALAYFAWKGQRERIRSVLWARPGLSLGIRAAWVGAAAAWIFNDTGVIPAVMILAAALVGLLAAWLEEPERRYAPDFIPLELSREM